MPSDFRLTDKTQRAVEKGWALDARMWKVLELIASEFETDPMSVQCFDLRIVEEAKALIREAKALDADLPFGARFS